MSRRSQTISLLLHGLFIALLFLWTIHPYLPDSPDAANVTHIFLPPPAHAPAGGGGMHETQPVRKGVLPPHSTRVFTPPLIQRVNYQPRLTIQPAIDAPPEVPVEKKVRWATLTASAPSPAAPAVPQGLVKASADRSAAAPATITATE